MVLGVYASVFAVGSTKPTIQVITIQAIAIYARTIQARTVLAITI